MVKLLKVYKCDRCGSTIDDHINNQLTLYKADNLTNPLDLCPDCIKSLNEWLNSTNSENKMEEPPKYDIDLPDYMTSTVNGMKPAKAVIFEEMTNECLIEWLDKIIKYSLEVNDNPIRTNAILTFIINIISDNYNEFSHGLWLINSLNQIKERIYHWDTPIEFEVAIDKAIYYIKLNY